MKTSVAAPVSLSMEPLCGPGKEFCFAKPAAGSIFIGVTDQAVTPHHPPSPTADDAMKPLYSAARASCGRSVANSGSGACSLFTTFFGSRPKNSA